MQCIRSNRTERSMCKVRVKQTCFTSFYTVVIITVCVITVIHSASPKENGFISLIFYTCMFSFYYPCHYYNPYPNPLGLAKKI